MLVVFSPKCLSSLKKREGMSKPKCGGEEMLDGSSPKKVFVNLFREEASRKQRRMLKQHVSQYEIQMGGGGREMRSG